MITVGYRRCDGSLQRLKGDCAGIRCGARAVLLLQDGFVGGVYRYGETKFRGILVNHQFCTCGFESRITYLLVVNLAREGDADRLRNHLL